MPGHLRRIVVKGYGSGTRRHIGAANVAQRKYEVVSN